MSRRKHRRNQRPTESQVMAPVQPGLIAQHGSPAEPKAPEALTDEVSSLPPQAPVDTVEPVAEPVLLVQPASPSTMTVTVTVEDPSLGTRLKRGRENKSLSREDMAQRLRLPVARIQDIEQDRFDQLGVTVYARSYLLRYAKLVDVPEILVRKQFPETDAPAVVSRSASEPQSSRRVQRWGRLASMVGLTAVLALSVFSFSKWQSPAPIQVRSLESPELPTPPAAKPEPQVAPAPDFAAGFEPASSPAVTEQAESPAIANPISAPETLMASMTPMPPSRPSLAPGDHEITLTASDDSWMELVEVGGRRIDQGLLRAGDSRRYVTRVPVRVRIGNSGGVQLKADGNIIDLVPLARRNVANLELFGASEKPATQVESTSSAEPL